LEFGNGCNQPVNASAWPSSQSDVFNDFSVLSINLCMLWSVSLKLAATASANWRRGLLEHCLKEI